MSYSQIFFIIFILISKKNSTFGASNHYILWRKKSSEGKGNSNN